MTPEECQHVNRDPKYPAACMDCGYLVDNPTVEVTPWTTEGDEDDAPWFDPPEPEPVPTVTKVAYLIPVTQQMLDDSPTPTLLTYSASSGRWPSYTVNSTTHTGSTTNASS